LLLAAILPLQPLVTPAEAQANIPVCCRAYGAHHCLMHQMGMRMQAAWGMDAPRFWTAQPCPYAHLHHAVMTASLYLRPSVDIATRRTIVWLQNCAVFSAPETQPSALYAPRGPPTLL